MIESVLIGMREYPLHLQKPNTQKRSTNLWH